VIVVAGAAVMAFVAARARASMVQQAVREAAAAGSQQAGSEGGPRAPCWPPAAGPWIGHFSLARGGVQKYWYYESYTEIQGGTQTTHPPS
jgi:hypothetical protein